MIPRLALFASDWCKYFDNKADILIDLTVHLALACEQGASQIISILLDTCLNTSNVGYHGVNAALSVKNVCREILEMILQEIDLLMRMKGPHSTGIALLTSIKQDLDLVVPLLLDANPLRVQTSVRLLSLLGAQSSTVVISAGAFALRNAKTDFHLAALVRLVSENVVVFPAIKPEAENPMSGHGYLTQALEQALRDIQYTSTARDAEARQLFRNLGTMLRWENSKKAAVLSSKLVSRAVMLNLQQISGLLMKTDDFQLANDIAETLDLLSAAETCPQPHSVQLTLKLTRAIIRYFFVCIREEGMYFSQYQLACIEGSFLMSFFYYRTFICRRSQKRAGRQEGDEALVDALVPFVERPGSRSSRTSQQQYFQRAGEVLRSENKPRTENREYSSAESESQTRHERHARAEALLGISRRCHRSRSEETAAGKYLR